MRYRGIKEKFVKAVIIFGIITAIIWTTLMLLSFIFLIIKSVI